MKTTAHDEVEEEEEEKKSINITVLHTVRNDYKYFLSS